MVSADEYGDDVLKVAAVTVHEIAVAFLGKLRAAAKPSNGPR